MCFDKLSTNGNPFKNPFSFVPSLSKDASETPA
jgi:hypothetical protein